MCENSAHTTQRGKYSSQPACALEIDDILIAHRLYKCDWIYQNDARTEIP